MKVLMTADGVGGVLTYATELATGLAPEAEVVVAIMGPSLTASQREALLKAGVVAIHDGGHALEWMIEPWDEVQAGGGWLLELEDLEQPDLVHLNGYVHGALPWSVPCLVTGHSCVLSWWRAVHGTDAPPEWERYRTSVSTGLRGASAVVAPSAAMLAQLDDLYGPWPGPSAVIHNGAAPPPPSGDFKRGLVLAAGRLWDEAKNLAVLDRAAEGLDWPVLVAGEPSSPEGAWVDLEHVRVLGRLSATELARWRRRAAVFAAPARYEPFGLAILEAAGDGCALVLGDIPSLRELWDGAARFVAPDDHHALQAALRELTLDDAERERLGVAARRRAARYSADAMIAGYRELHSRMLVGHEVPA